MTRDRSASDAADRGEAPADDPVAARLEAPLTTKLTPAQRDMVAILARGGELLWDGGTFHTDAGLRVDRTWRTITSPQVQWLARYALIRHDGFSDSADVLDRGRARFVATALCARVRSAGRVGVPLASKETRFYPPLPVTDPETAAGQTRGRSRASLPILPTLGLYVVAETPVAGAVAPRRAVFSHRPATAEDFPLLERLHRAAMFPSVQASIGWNDAVQRDRLQRHFQPSFLRFLTLDGAVIGCISVRLAVGGLHLAQFYLDPAFQRRGFGARALREVLADADRTRQVVTLRVLRGSPAQTFYERFGFAVVDDDTTELHMLRAPEPAARAVHSRNLALRHAAAALRLAMGSPTAAAEHTDVLRRALECAEEFVGPAAP